MLGLGTRLGLASRLRKVYQIRKKVGLTESGRIRFYNSGSLVFKLYNT